MGAMVWPDQTTSHRMEIQEAMERVPQVYEECRAEFVEVFGRDPGGAMALTDTGDADTVLLASASVATTAREVVKRRREEGEKVGLVKMRMFRPFPEAELRDACSGATRLGVLDRDYAAGVGGVWWQDARAAFQGHRDDLMVQDYLLGIGGGDVTPESVDRVLADLEARPAAGAPVWNDVVVEQEVGA
jgi:pyruvate/2-oxoacid:ferredoxin oxidoreductase alpha subunit